MNVPKISVVIPVHNAFPYVKTLLEDLPKTEAYYTHQIFVDDFSDDQTKSALLSYARQHSNVTYIRNSCQQLFTRTVNRGLRAAEPDTQYFVEINTDCRVKEGFINKMLDCLDDNPNTGVVGYPDGKPENGGYLEAFYPSRSGHPDYITGHCILFPKRSLEVAGVLCETDPWQAHIHSEREWCWKLAREGFRMFYVQSDLCIHDVGGPSWNRNLNWLNNFNYAQLWKGKDTL